MKNFPVISEGKEYWISRSVAVVIKLTALDELGNKYVLAIQRGKGTPDPEFVGSWCLPCGYLDYNETIKEAARRELFEETGLWFSENAFSLIGINDKPHADKRQNITFRFIVDSQIPIERLNQIITDIHSEKDEVSDIKFISLKEVNDYKWAFNHDKLIFKE